MTERRIMAEQILKECRKNPDIIRLVFAWMEDACWDLFEMDTVTSGWGEPEVTVTPVQKDELKKFQDAVNLVGMGGTIVRIEFLADLAARVERIDKNLSPAMDAVNLLRNAVHECRTTLRLE
jgi:hypothetical protein